MQLMLIALVAVLVRWCVSLCKYSGAGKRPMFGDYEAQRHWMEITYNLPVHEWYNQTERNDLQYWGLDYPPLTAYHSWLCGLIANKINPAWVALKTSRGFESPEHKLFMRYSVLVADILFFFPVVFLMFMKNEQTKYAMSKSLVLMLLSPGLILIDHGHFQYNCVSLGFLLLAVMLIGKGRELWGSVFFVLALNYKQMELFHAFPFFFYLLGLCFRKLDQNRVMRLMKIAITVITTFAVCWAPFLSNKDSALQVLHRLFPFSRGLYEDKVANVWCSLSVVVKLKDILNRDQLVLLCLTSTLLMCLPSSLNLLFKPSFLRFKYALINCSLVFFLFSFQVHEKSILIVTVIVNLFSVQLPFWNLWFTVISTFSMLPLLIKDGLLTAYIAITLLYILISRGITPVFVLPSNEYRLQRRLQKFTFYWSMFGVIALTTLSVFTTPPPKLPDLFPVLVSMYSCAHFLLFLIYFHMRQFQCQDTETTNTSHTTYTQLKKKQ
ncbi:dolichyl pyrophosphate Man9GlcNAc2 alpha-1,3-glucosyltransferase-like [Ylistrum balloti]|uniref:dolichyl pyrophosphate Man9GlcNAc2 alpha-1,3-glucosyltransferase-like n=1 Tax=Ylistrum balloti TaxID=509963 RepID=UPI002905DA7E|nr:dolichyl pyrophosphate Man9GlcNAc2 alpha-1,3-glucosyltransferase-like [Ylistrum balloti]